jgi:acrylyl-CoA reductase (NADPH)
VMCPLERRKEAWKRLETGLDRAKLAAMTHEIGLSQVAETAAAILDGQVRGRVVVKIS